MTATWDNEGGAVLEDTGNIVEDVEVRPEPSPQQARVLRVLTWRGQHPVMTTSEVHVKFNQRYPGLNLSRSTVDDHLQVLLHKGHIVIADPGRPRRWQAR